MYNTVKDLDDFYTAEIGSLVRDILYSHISGLWSDVHGCRVLGCGYAIPYIQGLEKSAERVIAMMPDQLGVAYWPRTGKNRVFYSEEHAMPIENVSIDRIVAVHYLEGSLNQKKALRELWRVLKPNGRMIMIVPNRMGVWARNEWSPFGRGYTFTLSQIQHVLKENSFVYERHVSGLFMPPLPDSPVVMRSANLIERMGQSILPFVAGVHIIEVSKQVYARVDQSGTGSPVTEKAKGILGGKPSAIPQ